MAIHRFVCSACGTAVEDDNANGVHVCPNCGQDMRWDINVTGSRGDYNHVSGSLAISPDQTAAHKKLFPDVGVLPDGRLQFQSTKSQERYCEKTGFHKVPQKLKQKGVRIA